MEHATVHPLDFDFLVWAHDGGGRHVVIFVHGFAVQHIIQCQSNDQKFSWLMDISHLSVMVGLTWKEAQKLHPEFIASHWEAAIEFYEREDDLTLYVASRLNFFKELTIDRHISARLLKSLMEGA